MKDHLPLAERKRKSEVVAGRSLAYQDVSQSGEEICMYLVKDFISYTNSLPADIIIIIIVIIIIVLATFLLFGVFCLVCLLYYSSSNLITPQKLSLTDLPSTLLLS
tara:strand:- start:717 stop:1034 length:318 start_codon:yes stop_codon:yes gene_type:complete